ncbi:hypothetical protein KI743_24235 [Vibrio sp. D420a]|uniref:hypothetical protein n=1 Tax=Vibrio sp. D420a TaxID=2836895 RepID=UPI00255755E9|nr:hypothetical protein [Vibrio sp. D420a]MDK9765103.1 hypothetical protein [Vibrio sp. D420a]
MKFSSTLCLFFALLFSHAAPASESWWFRTVFNSDLSAPDTASLMHDAELFDCGEEEGTLLCSDETNYYDLKVFVELELMEGKVSSTRFSLPNSKLNDTKAQLYLRKDGLQLKSATINGVTFDVLKELELAGEQGNSPQSVDQALVTFLNTTPSSSSPLDSNKSLVWHWPDNEAALVMMRHQDQEIIIELTRDMVSQ